MPMRIMKKLLSVAVSLSLCASLAAPAFAASFTEFQGVIDSKESLKDETTQEDRIGYDKDTDTVTLHEKVTRQEGEKSITIKDDVTIDLNDQTIDNGSEANSAIVVDKGASLTVKDSGEDGTITGSSNYVVTNNGTLDLKDGTVEATGTTGVGVLTRGDATIGKDAAVDGGDGKVGSKAGMGVRVEGTNASLTTEGNIEGYYGIYDNGGSVDVKGGTVDGGTYGGFVTKGGTISVDSGTVDGGSYGIYAQNDSAVNVTGGNVNGNSVAGIYAQTGSTVSLESGEVKGSFGIYATGENTHVDVKDGTVDSSRVGVTAKDKATADISGGSITGTNKGVQVVAGAGVTVDGDSTKIAGTGSAGVGVYIEGNKDTKTSLTVKNGTIDGTLYGISGNGTNDWTYYGGTEITITDGKVSGKYAAIYHPQYGTLIIGSKETDPTLSGYVGVQICAGVVDVYGGKFEATGATDNRPLKGTVNSDGLIDDASAISVVKRNGYISPPTVHIYDGSFSAIGNDALLTYGWTNNKVPTPGTKFDWADLQYTGVVGGRYSQEIKEVYLDKINFNDPDDLFFNLPHNKPNSDGQVICIHVDDETLPYQVGYLTGAPATGSTTALETGSAGRLNVRYMLNGQTVSNSLDQLIAENGWTSADESVLTVGQDGTITAVAPGETNVTVTLINGETVTFTVTVTEPAPELPDAPVIDDADDDDDDTTAAPGTEITDGAVPLASGPITRAEFINYLWQRDGQSESAGVCTFTDVEDTHPYFDALCWAEENGVAKAYLNAEGHEDGTFEPDELVTVGAAREFLTNFAAYAEMVMPEMKTLTGPDEEPLFTCDDVIREFFGD